MSFVDRWFKAGRESQYRRAIDFYNGGQYEAAVVAFREVLSAAGGVQDPRISLARFYLAEAHSELGWMAMDSGELARARDQFVAARDAGYRYPDLHLRLGRIHEELNEFEDADDAYGAALAIHTGIFEARARRARLRISQGKSPEQDLEMLVAQGIELPAGWERLGEMGAEAEIRAVREATVERLAEELEARDRVAEQVREALEAFDSSDSKAALEHLESAVAVRPQYPDLHFRIGVLHARAGHLGPAEQALTRALELNPHYEEAQRWLDRVRSSRAA